jgi:acetylornithine deacetylase/succinyl-diaminopimelate desuccinylase-like protein
LDPTTGSKAFNVDNPVELARKLIRFDTTNPPGSEVDCIAYIDSLLTDAGFKTTVLSKSPERPNLISRLKGSGQAPPLMLYGHVDVVPATGQRWKHPPFEGIIEDGYLWGRGALDMKSGVAMMLSAVLRAKREDVVPKGDIILLILSDEESGSKFGAGYMVDQHPDLFDDVRYAIGEFGGYTAHIGGKKFYPIQISEKQICWLKAVVKGPAGHGSRPLHGGAMAKTGELLRRLDRRRLPVHVTPVTRQMMTVIARHLPFPKGLVFRLLLNPLCTDFILDRLGDLSQYIDPLLHNTVNATIIRGGEKGNVIPDRVTVQLDGRLLPGFTPEQMMDELHQIIGREVELEVIRYEPYPKESDTGLFSILADILQDADQGAVPMPLLVPAITDGRLFAGLGIQSYGFTPMKLPPGFNFFKTIHGANERIPVEAIDFGANALFQLLQRYNV